MKFKKDKGSGVEGWGGQRCRVPRPPLRGVHRIARMCSLMFGYVRFTGKKCHRGPEQTRPPSSDFRLRCASTRRGRRDKKFGAFQFRNSSAVVRLWRDKECGLENAGAGREITKVTVITKFSLKNTDVFRVIHAIHMICMIHIDRDCPFRAMHSPSKCMNLTRAKRKSSLFAGGGHSSARLEPQIVDLAVAGSNPVGHPILFSAHGQFIKDCLGFAATNKLNGCNCPDDIF
jgi:hypothetical protein